MSHKKLISSHKRSKKTLLLMLAIVFSMLFVMETAILYDDAAGSMTTVYIILSIFSAIYAVSYFNEYMNEQKGNPDYELRFSDKLPRAQQLEALGLLLNFTELLSDENDEKRMDKIKKIQEVIDQ